MLTQKIDTIASTSLTQDICAIIEQGRQMAYTGVNAVMCNTYWHIGERIVEEEQQGNERAEYGKQLMKHLAKELTQEYGVSYSERNLWSYRRFYLLFNDIEKVNARVHNLTWSHFRCLLRVENEEARIWLMEEASREQWSARALDRNISTQYYQRLLLSPHKELVQHEMQENIAPLMDKHEFIKNPVMAEFLGLQSNFDFTESKLEQALISHLQKFLMELGKGFAFVGRQQHIRTDMGDYYIDLVFYNYILKCFFLIDLKSGRLTHQDVGQMDMYVRMYDELKREEGHNPTIGIVLGSETNPDLARYSVLHGSDQLFQAKYMLYLPKEEDLQREIEQQKEIFRLQQKDE